MIDPNATTGRMAYAKIYMIAKLARAMSLTSAAIARWTGHADAIEPPHEVVYIQSSKGRRSIRINIHRNKAAIKSTHGPTAVHMNWHGSGCILPLLGQNGEMIRAILNSEELAIYPLTILDCAYALSPEYPCPADAEDARDAYDYVIRHPELYDASRLTMTGFSAGGALALGLSATLGAEAREKEKASSFTHPVKAVITFYPISTWIDNDDEEKAPPRDMAGHFMPKPVRDMIEAAHFFSPNRASTLTPEEETKRKDDLKRLPAISPIFAPTQDFPPIVGFYTVEYDVLTKKTEELREQLIKDGGVEVLGKYIPGVGHGWDFMARKGQHGYEDRVEAYTGITKVIARVGGLNNVGGHHN
ncbi:alpha/beta-hydrolase [Serendipita vermifera]|nr:alpha/beta-hydrolase [Serendipita vermifera]